MDDMNKIIGEKIQKYRKSNNLNQDDLARMLNIKRPTLSKIESGERKLTASEIKEIAEVFNISSDELLGIKKQPEIYLEDTKPKDASQSIRISVPQKNLGKFKEVLLYILNKIGSKPNIGETVIYKLLYFIDFDYYEKYEEQLIGATYQKNTYGPTPIEFKKIIDGMISDNEIEIVKSKYFDYPQTKYLPHRKADLHILSGEELEHIDNELNRLSDMNASEISNYSHKDVPWLAAEEGGIIDYESVFYRTDEYSVRNYDEDWAECI